MTKIVDVTKIMKLKQRHNALVHRVTEEDYYPKVLKWMQENKTYDLTNPFEICRFWNDFWFLLPDHGKIRHGPFFDICDMAEGEYLDDFDNNYSDEDF